MRIDEGRVPLEDVDPVPRELGAIDVVLFLDHVMTAKHQVVDGDGLLHAIGVAVEAALAEARKVEDGLAQRLGGNGARVDTDAAHAAQPLDDGDAAAKLGRLYRGMMAGGAAANHHELVAGHWERIVAPVARANVKAV